MGIDNQAACSFDPCFTASKCKGANGWIELNIYDVLDIYEDKALIRHSYRHFALKRMLSILDPDHI